MGGGGGARNFPPPKNPPPTPLPISPTHPPPPAAAQQPPRWEPSPAGPPQTHPPRGGGLIEPPYHQVWARKGPGRPSSPPALRGHSPYSLSPSNGGRGGVGASPFPPLLSPPLASGHNPKSFPSLPETLPPKGNPGLRISGTSTWCFLIPARGADMAGFHAEPHPRHPSRARLCGREGPTGCWPRDRAADRRIP